MTEKGIDPGTKLGSFEIGRLNRVGAMGEVDRARETKLGREAAIKVPPEVSAKDKDRLARFPKGQQHNGDLDSWLNTREVSF